jgi:hypothetical protein
MHKSEDIQASPARQIILYLAYVSFLLSGCLCLLPGILKFYPESEHAGSGRPEDIDILADLYMHPEMMFIVMFVMPVAITMLVGLMCLGLLFSIIHWRRERRLAFLSLFSSIFVLWLCVSTLLHLAGLDLVGFDLVGNLPITTLVYGAPVTAISLWGLLDNGVRLLSRLRRCRSNAAHSPE